MWNIAGQIGRKYLSELITSSEANKPEAYIDRIKREFQLPEYADALVRYYSNPAYWKKLYGDDPLNSPNHPVPQDALPPPKGGSYLGAPSSSDPVYRGFPLLPDFHYQLQMPSPVDSFDTRFGKPGSIPNPPASFDDRFGKRGSAPVADPRDSFNDRFGNGGSVPAAGSGDTRSSVASGPPSEPIAEFRRHARTCRCAGVEKSAAARGLRCMEIRFAPEMIAGSDHAAHYFIPRRRPK